MHLDLTQTFRRLAEQAGAGDEQASQVYDPAPLLTPKQLEIRADRSLYQVWCLGRRFGKTTLGQHQLIEGALATPCCAVVYASTTIKRAVDAAWDETLRFLDAADIEHDPHEGKHQITFRNGSVFHVSGSGAETNAESKKLIDRWRGLKRLKAIMLDEMQDWEPSLVRYAIGSVIMPMLSDMRGRLILAGTGSKPSGYWYEVVHRPEQYGFSVHRGTIYDNPHIPDPDASIADTAKALGVKPDDPEIEREYKCAFTRSGRLQILHIGPQNLVLRSSLPKVGVLKVVGVDLGTVDACAVTVIEWVPTRYQLVLSRSTQKTGLSGAGMVEFVHEVVAEESQSGTVLAVVGDGGGLGKALVMDIAETEKATEVEPFKKAPDYKAAAMRTFRGAIMDGRFKVCEDEREWIELSKDPEWDPDHIGTRINGHVPDPVDSALGALRKALELFSFEPAAPQPKPRTPQQAERDEDAGEDEDARETKWWRKRAG